MVVGPQTVRRSDGVTVDNDFTFSGTEQVREEGGPPERSGSYTPSPSHVVRCWIPVLGKSTGIHAACGVEPGCSSSVYPTLYIGHRCTKVPAHLT